MKKFFLLSADDLNFLKMASSPYLPPEQSDWKFQCKQGFYIPKDVSLLNQDNAMWFKKQAEVLGAQNQAAFDPNLSLLSLYSKTHIFIPMNDLAQQVLENFKLPYMLFTELLSENQLMQTIIEGKSLPKQWLANVDYKKMNLSENWPAYHFSDIGLILFHSIQVAYALAKFLAPIAEEVVCLNNTAEIHNYHPMDVKVLPCIWKEILGDRLSTIEYNQPDPFVAYNSDKLDYSIMQDSMVVATLASTYERFIPFAKMLESVTKNRNIVLGLTLRTFMTNPFVESIISEKNCFERLHVTMLPSPGNADMGLKDDIYKHCEASLSNFFENKSILKLSANYYANLFAQKEQAYQALLAVWQKHTPAACFADFNNGASAAIPLLVAKALNIPSVGLPHAFFPGVFDKLYTPPADQYIVPNKLHEAVLEEKLIQSNKVVSFPHLNLDNEYFLENNTGIAKQEKKFCILILLAHTLSNAPLVVAPPQTEWIKAINAVPKIFEDKVEIKVKMHPRFHAHAVCQRAGVRPSQILPLDSNLDKAFESADLAVMCNYIGAPALHAMTKGVPVLYCFTESRLGTILSKTLLQVIKTGHLAPNPPKVWKELSELILNKEKREQIIRQQNVFVKTQLSPTRVDFEAWINEEVLRKK